MRIAVVGAGVIGLTVAFRLIGAGASVDLFDSKSKVGQGTTKAALGGITPLSDEFARSQLKSASHAILGDFWSLVDDLRAAGSSINSLDKGMLFLARSDVEESWLRDSFEKEFDGLYNFTWLGREQVRSEEPLLSGSINGALLIKEEKALRPAALIGALSSQLEKANNCTIKLDSRVRVHRFEGNSATLLVDGKRSTYDYVVICTGFIPPEIPLGEHLTRPIKGQALEFSVPYRDRSVFSHHIYTHLDERSKHTETSIYIVPRSNGNVAVGVTYEEAYVGNGVTADCLADICGSLIEIVPSAKVWELKEYWSGLRPGTVDDAPLIGPLFPGSKILLALGHYGLGVTLSAITANIILENLGLREENILKMEYYSKLSPMRFKSW